MARKRQFYRRPPRRPAPNADNQRAAHALESAARALAASHSADELRALAEEWSMAVQFADERAREEPGPAALERFRAARRTLAEVRRALELVG